MVRSVHNLADIRADFHRNLCDRLLVIVQNTKHGDAATNADASNAASRAVANHLAEALGAKAGKRPEAQTTGNLFEDITADFVRASFCRLNDVRPGNWHVERVTARDPLVIARFQQYEHLRNVYDAVKRNPDLAAVLGREYSVSSDVVLYKDRTPDELIASGTLVDETIGTADDLRLRNGSAPTLHASISCKWTMRSDRAQNSRTEALDLIRKRKGRVPHIVVVTGEPLPSRLSSLALGTGDLDCVYHIALPELQTAVSAIGQSEANDLLSTMTESKRLKDIADLPLDLAV